MSKFKFIRNKILQTNLDLTFQHLVELLVLLDDSKYTSSAKSSLRKTMIILTASIIEGILFYILDSSFTEEDLEIRKWQLEKKKVLYEVDENHQVIAGDYINKKEKLNLRKANLGKLNSLLKYKETISKRLHEKIDKVRILRNEQHLGCQKEIKLYEEKDLKFVFLVAKEVKDLLN